MNKRFYIKELRITGPNVKPAKINFDKGFNLITGGSNAGKSYIVSCIDFMLGANTLPKDIQESHNYDTAFLEIETNKNQIYALKRSIKTIGSLFLSESIIDEFGSNTIIELKGRKTKDEKNISDFLLGLCELDDKKVKQDKYNKTKNLSFRDISKYIIISEERIITENSPVFASGQVISQTIEKSTFHLLLSTFDASNLEAKEKPTDKKMKVEAKISFVDQLIQEVSCKIDEYNHIDLINQDRDIKLNLIKYQTIVQDTSSKIDSLSKVKQTLWNKTESLKSELLFKKELFNRFNLLKQHYDSDLNRLEFIKEGKYLFDQLNEIDCPICGNQFRDDNTFERTENVIDLNKAIVAETEKINAKFPDLIITINHLEEEIKNIEIQISDSNSELKNIDDDLSSKLKPFLLFANSEIKRLLELQSQISTYESYTNQLNELSDKRNNLQDSFSKIKEPVYDELSLEKTLLNPFCDKIEYLLKEWKYGKNSVNFDTKTYDITLAGRKRKIDGKGKRAITYSAFIIGLLDYCISNNQPHPGFLILDSPLTAYKKGNDPEKDYDLPVDIEKSLFNNLSTIGKDKQIIMFDNKDVDAELKQKINYIYYVGEDGKPSEGFFPNPLSKNIK